MTIVRARKPPAVRATVVEFMALPEEVRRRHELIDGELIEKGAASGEHGAAQRKLSAFIDPFDRRPGGRWPGGWWFATEVDVRFGEQILRPDVIGWRRSRVSEQPRGCPVDLLPDWTCEILSTKKPNDLVRKKSIYHAHRVPHYWILDPAEGVLLIYRWTADGYTEILAAETGQRVRAEPFEAIELSVGAFFGDDEDEAP
jgi:Uma2 family endonuclease